jgi:enoyl-CoA hydratase
MTATPEPETAVLVEARGEALVMTMNRPHARNALNQSLTDALLVAIARLEAEDELRVGVLYGGPDYFCAGVDLKAFAERGMPSGLGDLLRFGSSTKPIIAAVTGVALAGGLELALVCDLIVAAHDGLFGIPEARRGLVAAGGALIRLPQRLPWAVAMDMAVTGEPISAERAHALGLISRLCAPGQDVLDVALALAAAIGQCAPLSVAASREIVRASAGRTEEELWEHQRPFIRPVLRSNDAQEGARAFAEKRTPQWTGT